MSSQHCQNVSIPLVRNFVIDWLQCFYNLSFCYLVLFSDLTVTVSGVNQERKEWAQFMDSTKADTSSMSSDGTEDVWMITDEQREYYITQFKTMQEDVRGVISGENENDVDEVRQLRRSLIMTHS